MAEPVMDSAKASEAVAKFEPVSITLMDGSTAMVGKLSWLHFQDVWKELVGVIGGMLLGRTPTPDVPAETPAGSPALLAYTVNELMKLPQAVCKLVMHTTKFTEEQVNDLAFADVLQLAGTAIRINLLEMRGVMDFPGTVGSALVGGMQPTTTTSTESNTD